MANASDKLKLQQAHATNALNYGHLGTATYVEHSHDWAYLRSRTDKSQIDSTSDHNIVSEAFPFERISIPEEHHQPHAIVNISNVELRRSNPVRRALSPQFPEVLFEKIGEEAHSLATQEADLDIELCLQPGQLAFGGAATVTRDEKSEQTVPVAAIVTGRSFEAVRLLLIGRESIRVKNRHGQLCKYLLPKIDYEEEALWVSNGEAVNQVCFATAGDHQTRQSSWMAARCGSSTTVFHPLFHKTLGIAHGINPRLSLNPVVNIPMSRTGGFPHADIAFHPQEHQVLALVDVRGNWSVWKIDGRRAIMGRVLYVVHLRASGTLLSASMHVSLQSDWHRICWISRTPHEADRLLVTSHSSGAVFDLSGRSLGLLDIRSERTKRTEILDIARSNTNPTQCYVLTSTKVLLMSATEQDWTDPNGLQEMIVVFSWSHFRGRSDSSLRLTLVESGKITTILLTSANNEIVSAFRAGLRLAESALPVSIADPVYVRLLVNDDNDTQMRFKMLAFRDLQIKHVGGKQLDEDDAVLFKAFQGGVPGMPLEETLYRYTDNDVSSTFGQPQSTSIPLPLIRALRTKSSKYSNVRDLDDFVVADEFSGWESRKSSANLLEAGIEDVFDANADPTMMIDWQSIYFAISDTEGELRQENPPVELAETLLELRREISNRSEQPTMLQTLREMTNRSTYLEKAGAESSNLETFVTDLLNLSDEHVRFARSSHPHNVTAISDLNDISDQVFEGWVIPLPEQTDGRVRLSKTRLACSIAADLVLASVAIGSAGEAKLVIAETQVSQAEAEAHNIEDVSSSPQNSASTGKWNCMKDPLYSRLRRYGALTKPTVPFASSSTLTDLLAHLPTDMNSDPASYSWREVEKRLAAEYAAKEVGRVDPKAQRRAERRSAAHMRRLETQKQISQAVEQSFAPPTIMSSQFPAVGEAQSSQTRPTEDEPAMPSIMTQPTNGAFGSRAGPAGKAQVLKKKPRTEGF